MCSVEKCYYFISTLNAFLKTIRVSSVKGQYIHIYIYVCVCVYICIYIYTHTHILILVPFVLYSNSLDLSSSYSISKLHFIQCHKFYTHTHTHQFHITVSTTLLHTIDIYNMSILTIFFCKHFARNFHPYKV